MKYITTADRVFLTAEMGKKRKKKIGNIEIEIIGEQRQYDADIVTQDGIIVGLPEKLSSGDPVEIEIGDHVHVHHFLADEDHAIDWGEGKFYETKYNNVFCKEKDGKIIAIGQWVICEGVFEEKTSDSGIILTSAPERNRHKMVIKAIGPLGKEECGAEEGDTVQLFKEPQGAGDYELVINGITYYRVRAKDIAGVWQETE